MIFWTTASTDKLGRNPSTLAWVAGEDRFAAQRSNNPTVQRNSLLAKALLRALLFHATHKMDWSIKPDKHGKPSVWSHAGKLGPAVSLSHSRGMIACALSQSHTIGIDVEYHRPRYFTDIASLAFGPTEQTYACAYGVESFYKIWTLREARSKATGEGLASAANGSDQITRPWENGCWTDREWNFFYRSLGSEYSMAIATQDETDWSQASLTAVPPEDLL
jgi:4'-phosphopantetheinyl transferase